MEKHSDWMTMQVMLSGRVWEASWVEHPLMNGMTAMPVNGCGTTPQEAVGELLDQTQKWYEQQE